MPFSRHGLVAKPYAKLSAIFPGRGFRARLASFLPLPALPQPTCLPLGNTLSVGITSPFSGF